MADARFGPVAEGYGGLESTFRHARSREAHEFGALQAQNPIGHAHCRPERQGAEAG